MAPLYLWDYLDRLAVFLQFGWHAFDEGTRAGRAREGLSGANGAGDGVVPVGGAGHGGWGHAVLFLHAHYRCAQFGRSTLSVAMVWVVGACLGGGVRGNLLP